MRRIAADEYLNELMEKTEALVRAARSRSLSSMRPLLEARADLLKKLQEAKASGALLTNAQGGQVEQLMDADRKLRELLVLIHGALRERIALMGQARKAHRALYPRQEVRGHRINLQL